jgi:transglutaminase-like putative cysteine protease
MGITKPPFNGQPACDLTIRCGLEFIYTATAPTAATFLLKPQSGPSQMIQEEHFSLVPHLEVSEFTDAHGNVEHRVVLPQGQTRVRYDAFVAVPSARENLGEIDEPTPVSELPPEALRYTLPSRYCDSDKLLDFAFQQFGAVPHGLRRVRAICDWVHQNVEYRWGAGSPHYAASDIVAQRFGVCRDFAHTAIAFCRCFNIPARYVTGFVPDVAFRDPGTPMDFHAYFQVFIGGRWQTFDARFNVPRTGRVHIAHGLDAVDAAFSTLYGAAQLARFEVWAYQVDPGEVRLGDPIDLSKRLDGTPELRRAPRVSGTASSYAA